MQYMLLHSKDSLAFYLDDITKGCHALAKKNPGCSVQQTLNLMNYHIEQPNCFFLIGEHRKRCVGFMFAVAVLVETRWVEVLSLWTLPGLGKRVKFEAFDHLRKWCKDREITSIMTNITRGVRPHKNAPNGVYAEWLSELGFEEIGKVMRAKV